jgi:hypothetical protein
MIVTTEKPIGTGKSAFPLTRADVEQLRSTVESAAQLDLHLQNLQEIDLSYMDLQGVNLQGANLQRANLRGANLSEADLDGADLSHAYLGDTEATRVKLHRAKLSYATLRDLDLRGFNLAELDLQNADLNGTELQGAILHHGAFLGGRGEDLEQGKGNRKRVAPNQATILEEHFSPLQEREGKQIVSDREAYLLGEHAPLVGSDPVKLRGLFPQGFAFAQARQLFDTWLLQMGDNYDEQTIQAMWIGFAHRICDLYYENEPEA